MATCYVYDVIEQQHTLSGHPESRARLQSTMQQLQQSGLLTKLQKLDFTPLGEEQLAVCHRPAYIHRVAQLANRGGGYLDPDTYLAGKSYQAACSAAGAAVHLAGAIMQGQVGNGMSLMRPPGHHALADRGMGFCIFNNIALAAHIARRQYGAQRVLIIDFDVHHGNGTQALVEKDADIAYISTHQYPFYPGTGSASDKGQGNVLNIPLPAGAGDATYQRVFDTLILPFSRRFQPQLILASAGYDAHWRDPLALARLSLEGYAHLVRDLLQLAHELCQDRIGFVLEGGYDLEVLAQAVFNTLSLLSDPKIPVYDPLGPAPGHDPDVSSLITRLQRIHQLIPHS